MKIYKIAGLILLVLTSAVLIGAFFFVFNPLGLGPEAKNVLSQEFFDNPSSQLNELRLMIGGESAFSEILSAIETAQESIFVQTYIWKDDKIGGLVVEKLKAAADRGVNVTVDKDVLGTFFELGDLLKGKPSPVYTKSGLKDYNNITVVTDIFTDTDHSKYFILDRHMAIFGGMNIADEYHKQWHDYMIAIQSERWTTAFKQKVMFESPWPNPAPFFVAVNDRKVTEIRSALIQIIDHAAEQIIIEHAYFSDDKIIKAVNQAANRGVHVDVILPKQPDTHIYANQVTINRLLESSEINPPRIHLYPYMSHAKVLLIDGVIAAIGSANLTPRSMVTSKELTLFAHGKKNDPFIEKLRDRLIKNIGQSEELKKPFKLSYVEKIMAFVGKYVW